MRVLKAALVALLLMLTIPLALVSSDDPASAPVTQDIVAGGHAWNGYHWRRTSVNPEIRVTYAVTYNSNDSITSQWVPQTDKVLSNWSAFRPPTLNINFVKIHCEFYVGKCGIGTQDAADQDLLIEISNYGDNGWAGLATVWTTGLIIDRAYIQLNAFYFAADPTIQPYMMGVYCHEVGHVLGLGHNRPGPVDGTPDTTCMNDIELLLGTAANVPNAHDTAELGTIYAAFDPLPSSPDSATFGPSLPIVIDTFPAP